MQKAVEVESRGLVLRGMLHKPGNINKKLPMVCIYHGFGGNKTESHFIFVKLSRLLEKEGIASIRFDFGGSGESDGNFIDMTISKELEDAKAILTYAKNLDFVKPDSIGVVGFSLGGTISSMLAGDCIDDIKALCLWAPGGSIDWIVNKISYDLIKKARKIGFIDKNEIETGTGGLALGIGFVKEFSMLDVYDRSSKYSKNVLIIHGGKDEVVLLGSSERYLNIYDKNARLHIIKEANHTFSRLDWEKEVLDNTIIFFKNELKNDL
jgi:uncharacterized protein